MESRVARIVLSVSVILLVAGCTSTKANDTAATASAVETSNVASPVPAKSKVPDGYRVMIRDGKEYYCKAIEVTGSLIAKKTVCMTADEAEKARIESQDQLREMQRPPTVANPAG